MKILNKNFQNIARFKINENPIKTKADALPVNLDNNIFTLMITNKICQFRYQHQLVFIFRNSYYRNEMSKIY